MAVSFRMSALSLKADVNYGLAERPVIAKSGHLDAGSAMEASAKPFFLSRQASGDPADKVIHCGRCDACLLRKKGFAEASIADPTAYAA